MATFYESITPEQQALIEQARVFFVATAAPDLSKGPDDSGAINMSPKGSNLLQVIGPSQIAYLDYAGSGNETARHIQMGSPITLMVCSFDENAAIVRLYGRAAIEPVETSSLGARLLAVAPPEAQRPLKIRQVINVHIEKTMTSCGYGVPIMSYGEDRSKHERGRRYK
jgi:hypothetical protein